MCTHVSPCISVCVCTHVSPCISVCVCTHVSPCISVCVCMHVYVYITCVLVFFNTGNWHTCDSWLKSVCYLHSDCGLRVSFDGTT